MSVETPSAQSFARTSEQMALAAGRFRPEMEQHVYPILEFFAFAHLPPHLQEVSKPIGELAQKMADELPVDAETSAGLRKLLEAKDCFVRATLKALRTR